MSNENTTRAILGPGGKVLIEQPDGSYRPAPEGQTDWRRLDAMTDEQITAAAEADPDARPLDEEFWKTARVVFPPNRPKRHQGLRLDADVIDWFKGHGKGWQTRINAVLRAYVETHKQPPRQQE